MPTRGKPKLATALGIAACVIGLGATVVSVLPLIQFAQLPPGTMMRPMGLAVWIAMFMFLGLLVVVPLTAGCLFFGWHHRSARRIGLLAFMLSVSSVCSAFALFQLIVYLRGYVLED